MTTTKLSEAIAAAMLDVHRLKKDDKNSHGGYKYVSVDDVKDHVRPILGKNGLEVACSETSFEIQTLHGKNGQPSVNACITFEMVLRHTSGEASPPERITIMLPFTGAQTSGAARSYAVKEWIKARFLVSTGEKDEIVGGADADEYRQQEYTQSQEKKTQLLTREEARALYKGLAKELVSLGSVMEVRDWELARALDIKKLGDWREYIDAEIAKHIEFITAQKVAAE